MDELKLILDTMRVENKQNFANLSQQIQKLSTEISEVKAEVTELKLSLDYVDNEVRILKEDTVPSLQI